jgi:nucleoside-diphosphate-sugar epimerase
MITIMGATGNTGKKITEALRKSGEKVRARLLREKLPSKTGHRSCRFTRCFRRVSERAIIGPT